MSTITIQKIGITKCNVECIVNAANENLLCGGGVCGAIFKEAGMHQLSQACHAIGHCDTGHAVITPGYQLKAKSIIHAVGPVWRGGSHHEPQLLYSCYMRALELAQKHQIHSIAFPLISGGIFGYPKDKAFRKAIQACRDFLNVSNYDMEIVFAVLDDTVYELGVQTLKDIL